MSPENKAVVRRLFQEVWNRGNVEVRRNSSPLIMSIISPQPPGIPPGVRGLKRLVNSDAS